MEFLDSEVRWMFSVHCSMAYCSIDPSQGVRMYINAEVAVVEAVRGERECPPEIKVYVDRYRRYAEVRGECVSYPRHEDVKMDQIFDLMILTLQYNSVEENN